MKETTEIESSINNRGFFYTNYKFIIGVILLIQFIAIIYLLLPKNIDNTILIQNKKEIELLTSKIDSIQIENKNIKENISIIEKDIMEIDKNIYNNYNQIINLKNKTNEKINNINNFNNVQLVKFFSDRYHKDTIPN